MYIFSPKLRKKIFLDNSISDYEIRYAEVVTRGLTDEILDFCNNNASIKNNRQIQAYITAERILDNLSTYLLLGQFKKNNILTLHKIRMYNQREIQASQSDSNAEDLIYGTSSSGENATLSASTDIKEIEVRKNVENMSFSEINKFKKKDDKNIKKYKQSKTFRMEQLYSTRPVKTYRLKQVMVKGEDGKEKVAKNVFGQPIWDVEYLTIGGHQGIIDINKPYKSGWQVVDVDGKFSFQNRKFMVDMEKHSQYSVDREGEENKCEMEKILCYHIPHEDKWYFFDEEVRPLVWVRQA